MSVAVDSAVLRQEIARRGWSSRDLARAAQISPATVSAAVNGRPISATCLSLIARALAGAPPDEIIDKLLRDERPDLGLAGY
jgi:lambda repressor-like predicted transcriptional regulator